MKNVERIIFGICFISALPFMSYHIPLACFIISGLLIGPMVHDDISLLLGLSPLIYLFTSLILLVITSTLGKKYYKWD